MVNMNELLSYYRAETLKLRNEERLIQKGLEVLIIITHTHTHSPIVLFKNTCPASLNKAKLQKVMPFALELLQ